MGMKNIGTGIQNMIIGIIAAVIFIIVGVALGPTLLEATADINATTLADVPLGSVLVLLATYIGFFYYLAIVLGGMVMVWAVVQKYKVS